MTLNLNAVKGSYMEKIIKDALYKKSVNYFIMPDHFLYR